MLPLFDLMMQAQNGKAMEALARQFNLAQDQATKAVAALMPAFSAGLKRQSSNPFDFASLMQKATSGNYTNYFEDFARTFTPEGVADGNAALGQIFGSKEISRAIAAQAEQLTGVGQDILKKMLPAMADTMMGGIVKQMTGQMTGQFPNMMGQAANPFASAFTPDAMAAAGQQWMEAIGLAPKKPDPLQAQMQAMMDNPFTKAMQSFFTPKAEPQTAAEADPFSMNPFMKSFQDMMTGAAASGAPDAEKKGEAAPSLQAAPAESYNTFVNSLFDSGLEVQKTYQANLDAIFEQWTKKDS